MKRPFSIALASAFLLGAFQVPVSAAEAPASPTASPEALSLAQEIVDSAFPPERRQATIESLMQTLLTQMRPSVPFDGITDPGLIQILNEYMNSLPQVLRPATAAFLPKQMNAIKQAYARMFSLAQLKDIAAFARTPSGRAYLQRSPEVLSDPAMAAVNTQYFSEAQRLSKAAARDLATKVTAYLELHPDVAKSMSEPKAAEAGNEAR